MTPEEAVKKIEQLQTAVESLETRTRQCERVRDYVILGGAVLTIAVVIVFGWHPRDVARKIATEVAANQAEEVASKTAEKVAEDVASETAKRTAEVVAAQEATIALPILRDKVTLVVRELVPHHVQLAVRESVPIAVNDAVKASTDETVVKDIQQQRDLAQRLVREIGSTKAALSAIQQNEHGDIEIRGRLNVVGGPITVSSLDGREATAMNGNSISTRIDDKEMSRIDNAGGQGNLYLSNGVNGAKLSADRAVQQGWLPQ